MLQTPSPVNSEAWQADLARLRESATLQNSRQVEDGDIEQTHTEIQGKLRDLGLALGFDVWIASNDQSRTFRNGTLGQGCVTRLPDAILRIANGDAVRLIDILWLELGTHAPVAAFEVEHSTSFYSGIVRLLDLALGFRESGAPLRLFLVAPDKRSEEVRAQLRRPAFSKVQETKFFFVPYGELQKNFEAMGRFGQGIKAIEAIAERLTP